MRIRGTPAIIETVVQGPQFRAQWAKQLVSAAKRTPETVRERLLKAIGEDTRRDIRSCGLLDFVEPQTFCRVLTAAYTTLDETQRNQYYSSALASALETPLLKPLYRGGSGMFGKTPAGILRMTPFVWRLLTKACGQVEASEEQDSTLQLLFKLTSRYAEDRAFAAAMAGYMYGALAWTERPGTVAWESPGGGVIDYRVRWK